MIMDSIIVIALAAGAFTFVVQHFRLDQLERRLDHYEETRRFHP